MGTLIGMDWTWFWSALGEVVKNAGPLVVGVAGIVGTYMAGNRSIRASEAQERVAYRRQAYAEFMGTAGEVLGYVSHFAGMVVTFSNSEATPAMIRAALQDSLPAPLPPDTLTRLARSEAMVQMLESDKALRDAASGLLDSLRSAFVWSTASTVSITPLDHAVMDAGRRFRSMMDLLRQEVRAD